MKRCGGNAGFTILELLVTLFLLAVIATSIVGGLQFGRRAWELGKGGDEVEPSARILAHLIARTLPSAAIDAHGRPALVFVGRPHSLIFVSLSEGETQFAGPALEKMALFNGAAGAQDLALWTSVFRVKTAWTRPRSQMRRISLLKGVSLFKLSYFGVTNPLRPPHWRLDWVGQDRLPLLIAIRMVVTRGLRRHVIDLSARLRQF